MINQVNKRKIRLLSLVLLLLLTVVITGLMTGSGLFGKDTSIISIIRQPPEAPVNSIIPKPVVYKESNGVFTLTSTARIYVHGSSTKETKEILNIGQYLADALNPSTGYDIRVSFSDEPQAGGIYLTTINSPGLGDEGYQLSVSPFGVKLSAFSPEGLFRGVQTIKQMLPAKIAKGTVSSNTDWIIPCAEIIDYPSYAYRGMMLDVARHFFTVGEVKLMIDRMAEYKMNQFHLHLTDDQGWRLEIKSRPKLTSIGGSSEVGGGGGGYYTQEDYLDIIRYANSRYITVIPEIDLPGHCNAALASYGELNPDGVRKELYTGIDVGFSSLMCRSEVTYDFVDDVIGELASLTPGDYIHIGGDETSSTPIDDYNYFMGRVNEIVKHYGKKVIGWNPMDESEGIASDAVLQNWNLKISSALSKDMKIIQSPSMKAYLDMKYDDTSPLGLIWAGLIPTDTAYQWDPSDYSPAKSILGIECPLWSETIETMDDMEYLAFPRLLGYAEIGWTPKELKEWKEYKLRLKDHALRMTYQGINYYKDPVVGWES